MSPRFDEVRRLAELEKKAEPNWIKGDMGNIYSPKSPTRYPLLMPYGINASSAEVQIAVDLRNAAPWLLEVAGCFQPGDAHELDVMSTFFSIPREGMTTTSYQKWLQWALILTRLQKAAEIMEERE